MIPPGAASNIASNGDSKLLFALAAAAIACSVLIYTLRQRDSGQKSKSNAPGRIPGMPKVPGLGAPPQQKEGGQRRIDAMSLSPEALKKRTEAHDLAKKGQLKEAALLLESVSLQREAIDLLESNSLLDDAAAMLMRMNRPNRAAVIYERNKRYEHAAIYFLKAKLVDDAKRCCTQIKDYNLSLSIELAVLYADAGDNKSALRLLAGINDKTRIMKIVREKFAYSDLAQFLDYPAARQLLMDSLVPADIEHMLQNMPDDGRPALGRALLWLNEGKKPGWLNSAFNFIGDKRDVAAGFAERLSPEICDNFGDFVTNLGAQELHQNKQAIEWAARAMHDAFRMQAAAKIYEKLSYAILAGKCWAISGDSKRALAQLTNPEGDLALAGIYQQELNRMGRFATDQKPLADHERDALSRLFFNVDPDTERNRSLSPFSIAS